MRTIITALLLLIPSNFLIAQDQTHLQKAVELIDHVNQLYFKKSSHAVMNLRIKRPTFERNLTLEWFSRGFYNIFLKILAPSEQEGKSILKAGKELFFYEPKEERVIHISQTGALRRFLLSEFSRDDFLSVNKLSEEYHLNLVEQELIWILTLTPKMITPIVWDKIVYRISKDEELPVSKTYFNEKGAKAKELLYKKIKNFGEFRLPSVLEMHSFIHPGFVSRLEYTTLEFNIPVLPHLFTMKNLKNLIEYDMEP